ncbi:hypothetical protein HK414_07590 [Ramlibacter terrae]|uniref:LysR substrate-binding domain-containing protein n=1 Tax=Ramlibacter terrae TaxID=2732511 RepID=A0ABX6P0Q1_9BURK|nr:hypothetical protein HK414_07590 [Ramlibacter terrae]
MQGSVDLGLVVPPLDEARGLRVKTIRREELVLAVPAEHALAGLERVQLKDRPTRPSSASRPRTAPASKAC